MAPRNKRESKTLCLGSWSLDVLFLRSFLSGTGDLKQPVIRLGRETDACLTLTYDQDVFEAVRNLQARWPELKNLGEKEIGNFGTKTMKVVKREYGFSLEDINRVHEFICLGKAK
ncbi:MAG: hypothetical protein AAB505_00340 [Patescibacteria group bacterium]